MRHLEAFQQLDVFFAKALASMMLVLINDVARLELPILPPSNLPFFHAAELCPFGLRGAEGPALSKA
jgi:hypothetical protein